MEQDEYGQVRADGRIEALRQRARLAQVGGVHAQAAGLTRSSWTLIGPTNVAGRVKSLAVHRTRPGEILIASDTGGFFRSTNGGGSWAAVDDFLASLRVRKIAVHPTAPDVVYAATSDGFVLTSSDFGGTWAEVSGVRLPGLQDLEFDASGGVLYLAGEQGLHKLTLPNSLTRLNSFQLHDIEVSPHGTLIATRYLTNPGVTRSTDGGATWQTAAGVAIGANEYAKVAFASSSPSTVYVLSGDNFGTLYRSVNDGASFTVVTTGPVDASGGLVDGQSWHNLALWVNPLDSQTVIAAGIRSWLTTNGGQTWRRLLVPGVDFHDVIEAPGFDNLSNRRVFAVYDQGLGSFADYSSGGLLSNTTTQLPNFQVYAATADASGRVLFGSQDNGTHMFRPSAPGQALGVNGSDGGPGVFDPSNSDRAYTTTPWLNIFRTEGLNAEFRTAVVLTGCLKPPPFRLDDACAFRSLFIAPFVMDPHSSDRVYAGGLGLWRSDTISAPMTSQTTADGPTWLNLGVPGGAGNDYVSAIAVSPSDPDVVWVGRVSGRLYRTDSATAASPVWTEVGAGALPYRYVTHITIVPRARAVYVTSGGFAANNIHRTTDNGATWRVASGRGSLALPEAPVYDLEVHPAPDGAHWLYAATQVGVFTSEDGGATWGVPSEGPSSVQSMDLFWSNTDLHVATYGRSLWRAPVSPPTAAPCSFVVAPGAIVASAAGGTADLALERWLEGPSPCAWTATASASWFQVTPDGGSDSATLRVSVQSNPGPGPRAGTITVGGVTVAVNQVAPSTTVAPGQPVAVAATVTGSTLTLRWQHGYGGTALDHEVEAGVQSGVYALGRFRTRSSLPVFTVADVPNGVYFVRVRAANAVGVSPPSGEIRVPVPQCTVPAAPAATAAVSGGVVSVAWTAVGGAQYRLEAGDAVGVANLAVLNLGATGSFSAAPPPGTYYLRLRAMTPCGVSAPSNEMTVTVAPPAAPAAPTNLTHTVLAGRRVELQWTAPGGSVSGYRLEAGSTAGAGNLAVVTLGPSTAASFADVPSGIYYVRIRALNGSLASAASNETVVVVP